MQKRDERKSDNKNKRKTQSYFRHSVKYKEWIKQHRRCVWLSNDTYFWSLWCKRQPLKENGCNSDQWVALHLVEEELPVPAAICKSLIFHHLFFFFFFAIIFFSFFFYLIINHKVCFVLIFKNIAKPQRVSSLLSLLKRQIRHLFFLL